jgi:hypothetical protein
MQRPWPAKTNFATKVWPRLKVVIRRISRIVPQLGQNRIGDTLNGPELATAYVLGQCGSYSILVGLVAADPASLFNELVIQRKIGSHGHLPRPFYTTRRAGIKERVLDGIDHAALGAGG